MTNDTLTAAWITCPGITGKEYGIYHFRKKIKVDHELSEYTVRISGDNRYELFVNGKLVCFGPAKSDIAHYKYDVVDLKPFLVQGGNSIAVTVWNYGDHMPLTQLSLQTAFYMQGTTAKSQSINTNESWKVSKNLSYSPITDTAEQLRTYFVAAPGDKINSAYYPWGWEAFEYDDTLWESAVKIALPKSDLWQLESREIPFMEAKQIRFQCIRKHDMVTPALTFIMGESELIVPSNTNASILLDNGVLTNAYPVLITSFGKDAEIKLTYNEALYDNNRQKSHRDTVCGMKLSGLRDSFILDGGKLRKYKPLSYRTYRYVTMEITTKDEPVTIHDFYGLYTAYPFVENAFFKCNNEALSKIWDISWRTARLCAHETYMDCPYYEQAQYLGDTRIQCLISLYVSGDDRLMRQALKIFRGSIESDGLTLCAYPANGNAKIPPFSLLWINMIHDYWMLRKDDSFLRGFFDDIAGILCWFEERVDNSCNLLGELSHWNFVDWAWPYIPETNTGGIPSGANIGEKHSAMITLQFVYSLLAAAELFSAYKQTDKAVHYSLLAKKLKDGVLSNCWNSEKGLLSDTPEKKEYSQHTNIFGILTGCIDNSVIEKVLTDISLRQVTLYFRFYLNRALKKTGCSEKYMSSLSSWAEMLQYGFTTFPEINDYVNTRSDCHAWSASPLYDFLTIIAGIEPGEPGFKSIDIAPSFNGLKFIKAKMPHPSGEIIIDIEQNDASVTGEVELPANTTGHFKWNGMVLELKEGKQRIAM